MKGRAYGVVIFDQIPARPLSPVLEFDPSLAVLTKAVYTIFY